MDVFCTKTFYTKHGANRLVTNRTTQVVRLFVRGRLPICSALRCVSIPRFSRIWMAE